VSTEPDRSKSENSELPADAPVGPSGDGRGPAEISSDAEARPEPQEGGVSSSEKSSEAGSELQEQAAEEVAAERGEAESAATDGPGDSGGPGKSDDADASGEVDEDDQYQGDVAPLEEIVEEEQVDDVSFDWYILKVQNNREDSIREALQRGILREGLERYFGEDRHSHRGCGRVHQEREAADGQAEAVSRLSHGEDDPQ
jgi:hypothetical protein